MKYIALTGPMYSGKTRLAEALAHRHYMHIPFNDQLKYMAVVALEAVGVETSIYQIKWNKKVYRAFLQELGSLVDFDTDPRHIVASLEMWIRHGKPNTVFDNVRTNEQADTLAAYGFQLVHIRIDTTEQKKRAAELGVSEEELGRVLDHPAEQSVSNPYISIDGTRAVEENVELLINL